MHRNSVLVHSPNLLFILALVFAVFLNANAQNSISVAQPRHSVSVIDSTKEQDGLVGSVRRVKTESAKVEFKDGQLVEGPLQLLELTTYAIKGNRIENVSYPSADPQIGKEEYKYDTRGNITEMTLRDDRGSIVSREAYSYEFDDVGNWTKMVTSLVLFENGQLKREPVENTYRTITYYFDDNIAKIVDSPDPVKPQAPLPLPQLVKDTLQGDDLQVSFPSRDEVASSRLGPVGDAPALVERLNTPTRAEKRTETKYSPAPSTTNVQVPVINAALESTSNNGMSRFRARKTEEPAAQTPSQKVAQPNSSSVQVAVENTSLKSAPVAEQSVQKAAFELYETGLSFIDKGDPKAAVGAFLASVKLQPSASVYLNLGSAYLKLEKNSDAAKALGQSVKLNPAVAEAQYGLGLASFRLKRYPEAREAFKKAIQLQPKMAKAHYGLGLTYLELGMPDASVVEMRILETLDKKLAKQLAGTFPRIKDPCRFTMLCQ